MADPQSLVGRIESRKEESENDGSSGSYESSLDPFPQPKSKRSSGPQDEDYVPEEKVYEH
jgi:hypothetical protein